MSKRIKITFNKKFDNFNKFIDYISNNINNLNINDLTILNKLENIYNSLSDDNIFINSKFKRLIIDKFNFKYKNRLQIGFWKERGYENSNEIVSNIQKINTEKVKNRFVSTSENLLALGYDKETIRSWRAGPNMIKYWINKGYNKEESKIKVSEYQRDLTKLIDYKKRLSNTSKEYYLNKGYNEKEAKKLLTERQNTINLNKYIKKHGEEKGLILYKEKVLKRSKYLGCSKKGYSNISQDLFKNLYKSYDNCDNILYAEINNEFKINKKTGYWLYDFTDIKNKKIIEFQGDRFHANPNIYKEYETPHPFLSEKTSKDIWINDELKRLDAIKQGFYVFYVWESDYRKDKDLIISKCIDFLKS
jgi:hypothetical protein